jgi:hypothetical protein
MPNVFAEGVEFLRQTNDTNCYEAALLMANKYWGKPTTIYVPKLAKLRAEAAQALRNRFVLPGGLPAPVTTGGMEDHEVSEFIANNDLNSFTPPPGFPISNLYDIIKLFGVAIVITHGVANLPTGPVHWQHCLVLKGVTDTHVIYNDPNEDNGEDNAEPFDEFKKKLQYIMVTKTKPPKMPKVSYPATMNRT